MNFLETEDVVKQYANHLALDKVSIQVPEGKVFGLLGPNGAGKTTLIRIINRITAPDSGLVRFNGREFQPEAIYLAQLKGLSYQEARIRLIRWFEKFDIMPWWNKKLEELSKGMQQKIQFIITIIHEPKLLIFDEPFSGFDPVNAELLKKEILELKDAGHTIIFSTHNMSSVEDRLDQPFSSCAFRQCNRSEKPFPDKQFHPPFPYRIREIATHPGNVQPADGKRPGRNKRGTHP